MAKYVSPERLARGIARLAEFRESVNSQGVQHILSLLALRQHGVNVDGETPFEEQDDFAFWDRYFEVDTESREGRYYDPFAGIRRIATHPHSNVATARKGTFANSWRAATFRREDGETLWRLEEDWVRKVVAHSLTKRGETRKVPVLDLIAWIRRQEALPDNTTLVDLVDQFLEEFGLSPPEFTSLFEVTTEDEATLFSAEPTTTAEILDMIGEPPDQAPPASGALTPSASAQVEGRMALPPGVVSQAITALSVGSHLILAGPPGTGKSTLAESLAAEATREKFCSGYKTVTATADWTTFDTIGGYLPSGEGNELIFREGLILQAIREDSWCIVDELNRANIDRAIGSLITLLAGSEEMAIVELPFRHLVSGEDGLRHEPVRIRRDVARSESGYDEESGDFVIGSNWRLIATMNTLDRNNLFPLTAAFARRFATVFVGIPPAEEALDTLGVNEPTCRAVLSVLMTQQEGDWVNPRPLGPAFAKDVWKYVQQRLLDSIGEDSMNMQGRVLTEALILYVLPQFTGMHLDEWGLLRDRLVAATLIEASTEDRESLLVHAQQALDDAFKGLQGEY